MIFVRVNLRHYTHVLALDLEIFAVDFLALAEAADYQTVSAHGHGRIVSVSENPLDFCMLIEPHGEYARNPMILTRKVARCAFPRSLSARHVAVISSISADREVANPRLSTIFFFVARYRRMCTR